MRTMSPELSQCILKGVAFFEANPLKWTTFSSARDKHDNFVLPKSPDACKWCMTGWMVVNCPQVDLTRWRNTIQRVNDWSMNVSEMAARMRAFVKSEGSQ